MRGAKLIFLLLPLGLASLPAVANTCNPFDNFSCAKSTPNNVHVSASASDTFNVSFVGKAAQEDFTKDELVILAAAPNGLTGSVNGVSFTSLGTDLSLFPEGGAAGAIADTWAGLNITANNIEFGFVNVGSISGNPMSFTVSGVGQGTLFYGLLVNTKTGQVLFATANSEIGVVGGNRVVTPEPASLTLIGTGLACLAGLVRRKVVKR
jgi:hypothetical protein